MSNEISKNEELTLYKNQIKSIKELLNKIDTIELKEGNSEVFDLFCELAVWKHKLIPSKKIGHLLTAYELRERRFIDYRINKNLRKLRGFFSAEQFSKSFKHENGYVRVESVVFNVDDEEFLLNSLQGFLVENLFELPDKNGGDVRKIFFIGSRNWDNKTTLMSQIALHIASEVPLFFREKFAIQNNRDERGEKRPIIWISYSEDRESIEDRFSRQYKEFMKLGFEGEFNIFILTCKDLEKIDLRSFVLDKNPIAIFVDDFFLSEDARKDVKDWKQLRDMYKIFKPYRDLANMGYLSIFSNPFGVFDEEEKCLERLSEFVMYIGKKQKEEGYRIQIRKCNYLPPCLQEDINLTMEYPIFK